MRRPSPLLVAILLAACGDEPATPPPSSSAGPACAAPSVDVGSAGGLPSATVIEHRVAEIVARDLDAHACTTRVIARATTMQIEASHDGETVRARLAAATGTPSESFAAHVAAHRLMHTLLRAHVESAVVSGRGVALGFGDHAALCYRASATEASCVRAPPVASFDSVREPSVGRLVVRAITPSGDGTEWELVDGALSSRTAPLATAAVLGTPPPAADAFARVRSVTAEASPAAPDDASEPIAEAMPPGAATVRLETRTLGPVRVIVLSRCEGMLARCVTLVATTEGATTRLAPSLATDPARIDVVEDASALAPGAIGVRVIEAGFHEGSASELFVLRAGDGIDVHEVALGTETERGEEETTHQGCYRTLAIEAPGRVRLSGARGWSGVHSDARGWRLTPSTSCATEEVRCLGADGFGACGS